MCHGRLDRLPGPPAGRTGWPWTEESPQLLDTMPDGKKWPKITIVTPSYNQGKFVEETIRSVLLQGYPNLEYIIIDGGSTDNSVEVIKKYGSWLTYWVSEPDRGQSHAINKGWRRSTGEILAWLNSDDMYEPEGLRKATEFLVTHPNVDMVYGDCRMISEDSRTVGLCPTSPFDIKKLLCFEGSICQQTVFLRKRTLDLVGDVDERLHVVMDTDLWIKIALAGLKIQYIPELLGAFRIYPENKTSSLWELSSQEKFAVLNRNFTKVKLPAEVVSLKKKAYSNIHKFLGVWYYCQFNFGKARRHLLKCIWLYPSCLREWQVVKLLILTLSGKILISRIRQLRAKLG